MARRFSSFIFIVLLAVFAAGCTSLDRRMTQTVSVTGDAGEKSEKKLISKQENMKETVQGEIEAQAFAAPAQKPEIQEYHLPHATLQTENLIRLYANAYDVPERLVRRVVRRESHGNPLARNGPYWGLMQISYPTAMGMGYQGKPEGLLDAETNLKYAVKYLAGAYIVAGGDESQAVRLYARGFYYDAKAKGLLERTGLRPGPTSIVTAFVDE